jgi:hypothetical protein
MDDLVNAIALGLLALVVAILQPSSARCDRGWSLGEGIRRDGRFACYSPPPHDCGEPRGPYERPCPPARKKYARIYCTGGSVPVIQDERTVGCTR